jgi:hypothetical protein
MTSTFTIAAAKSKKTQCRIPCDADGFIGTGYRNRLQRVFGIPGLSRLKLRECEIVEKYRALGIGFETLLSNLRGAFKVP